MYPKLTSGSKRVRVTFILLFCLYTIFYLFIHYSVINLKVTPNIPEKLLRSL